MSFVQGQNANISDFTGLIWMFGGSSAPTGFLLCDGAAVSRSTYAGLFAVIGTAYGTGDGSTTFNIPDLRSSVPIGKGQRSRTMSFNGASAVDPSTDQITVDSNDWLYTGQAVALTGSSLPAGLSATTYYVIRVNETTIKLATTIVNAAKGTAVDITADGSGTCSLAQTLTTRAIGATGGEEAHALTGAEVGPHKHPPINSNYFRNQSDGGSFIGGGSNSGTPSNQTETGFNDFSSAHNNMPPYTVVNYIIKT